MYKKFVLTVLFCLLSAFSFAGCQFFEKQEEEPEVTIDEIDLLQFSLPEEGLEISLRPDYKKEVFFVNYQVYGADASTEAEVGAEYFDQFLDIVTRIQDETPGDSGDLDNELVVKLIDDSEVKEDFVFHFQSGAEIAEFYSEVSLLFQQDIY